MVFVFTSFVSMNASTNEIEVSKSEEKVLTMDCIEAAWEFGSWAGENDPYWEWYWTNKYFEQMC